MPAANSNIANPSLWIWDKMKRPGCDTGITSRTLELLKAGATIEPKPKRGQKHVGKGSTRTTNPTMIPYQTFRKLIERLRRVPECGMTENREWLSPTLRLRTRPVPPQRRRANNTRAAAARVPAPAPKHKRKTAPSRLERMLRHGTLASHRSDQRSQANTARPKRNTAPNFHNRFLHDMSNWNNSHNNGLNELMRWANAQNNKKRKTPSGNTR